MNNYIHVLDADGKRITSIVDNTIEPIGETALREQAKSQYPDATQYIYIYIYMAMNFQNF